MAMMVCTIAASLESVAISLDLGQWQLLETGLRGILHAKIVHRKAVTIAAQLLHLQHDLSHVVQHVVLGQFKFQQLRIGASLRKYLPDFFNKIRLAEL